MEFLVNLFNHNELGKKSLEDVVGIFGHQLRALGHTAVWDPEDTQWISKERGYNIVVEGFVPTVIRAIADGYANGARFLFLATEEPTDKGFNHGLDKEMVMRQDFFKDAAKFAEGILHLVPGERITNWYGQFAPSAPIELGFAPSLIRPNDFTEPVFDFGFFGSLSPRRIRILKRLARWSGKEKAVRVVSDFASQEDRDRMMRQAKVIVQIRKYDQMGLVSSSRCNTALSIGRPIVAEPHDLSKPWDEIVHFSKTLDSFYDEALAVKGLWRAVHAGQLDRFKTKLSPENCAGRALREIGITSVSSARAA